MLTLFGESYCVHVGLMVTFMFLLQDRPVNIMVHLCEYAVYFTGEGGRNFSYGRCIYTDVNHSYHCLMRNSTHALQRGKGGHFYV